MITWLRQCLLLKPMQQRCLNCSLGNLHNLQKWIISHVWNLFISIRSTFRVTFSVCISATRKWFFYLQLWVDVPLGNNSHICADNDNLIVKHRKKYWKKCVGWVTDTFIQSCKNKSMPMSHKCTQCLEPIQLWKDRALVYLLSADSTRFGETDFSHQTLAWI